MSGDNRKVTTDALETLGTIIGDKEARDAIHLAVLPAEAGQLLRPGQHIVIVDGKACAVSVGDGVGIVDPFLAADVRPSQRFWLVVYPRQISSLRHVWSHPAFPDSQEVTVIKTTSISPAETLIRDMAEGMGLSYGALIDYGRDHAKGWDDGYVTQQGHESWRDGFDATTFWPAFETITGETVPEDKKDHFFSCSC
jgi:hypothetical protein